MVVSPVFADLFHRKRNFTFLFYKKMKFFTDFFIENPNFTDFLKKMQILPTFIKEDLNFTDFYIRRLKFDRLLMYRKRHFHKLYSSKVQFWPTFFIDFSKFQSPLKNQLCDVLLLHIIIGQSCFNKVGHLHFCKQSKRGWEP